MGVMAGTLIADKIDDSKSMVTQVDSQDAEAIRPRDSIFRTPLQCGNLNKT